MASAQLVALLLDREQQVTQLIQTLITENRELRYTTNPRLLSVPI